MTTEQLVFVAYVFLTGISGHWAIRLKLVGGTDQERKWIGLVCLAIGPWLCAIFWWYYRWVAGVML